MANSDRSQNEPAKPEPAQAGGQTAGQRAMEITVLVVIGSASVAIGLDREGPAALALFFFAAMAFGGVVARVMNTVER